MRTHEAAGDTFVEVGGIARQVLEQWGVEGFEALLKTGIAVQSIKGGS